MKTKEQWFEVQEITDDILAIDDNGDNTIYLVRGSKRALLIDTGWGIGDLKELISELTELPIVVVNTHGHPDHVGGAYQFDNVHITKADAKLLKGCFERESREWALEKAQRGPYPPQFDVEGWLEADYNNLIFIKDGHQFDLGDKNIEVIALPSHSAGSICLLDKEDKALFTGDAIVEGHIWLQLGSSKSLNTFLAGLKKIKSRIDEFDMVLPAHRRTPLEADIVDELIIGIEGVLAGEISGKEHRTFAGDGLLYEFDKTAIVYDQEGREKSK
ncbi:MBL fold metallo-hydrolase [Halanaerobacter jeridensis]|uniref:Glyoxylase-like metal-dependent hydrolase (Beta-lactamase superfamily II) n=1 Tax=Halanaerobacter jeridensis TaxID=706427 RepID=A0A939BQH2_9FIRM|nr:MBL fold metallo-hydrolase [Halanaerobacter jeridensis]MBM7556314.1 glyoxylase-like metal-dependent hydrolase (beta-lactamase superfamily II) [Halanaerobacter jeridensis]